MKKEIQALGDILDSSRCNGGGGQHRSNQAMANSHLPGNGFASGSNGNARGVQKQSAGRVPLGQRLNGIDQESSEVEHLSNLFHIQLLRVEQALDYEKEQEYPQQAGDRQVETARKLLSDLIRLKFDLGMLKKSQDEKQEYLNPYEQAAKWGNPTLGELLEGLGDEEEKTVIRILEKALLGMPCSDGSGVSSVVGPSEYGSGGAES